MVNFIPQQSNAKSENKSDGWRAVIIIINPIENVKTRGGIR